MSFQNPADSSEILYGSSGDVRDELNAHVLVSTGGHYMDEKVVARELAYLVGTTL